MKRQREIYLFIIFILVIQVLTESCREVCVRKCGCSDHEERESKHKPTKVNPMENDTKHLKCQCIWEDGLTEKCDLKKVRKIGVEFTEMALELEKFQNNYCVVDLLNDKCLPNIINKFDRKDKCTTKEDLDKEFEDEKKKKVEDKESEKKKIEEEEFEKIMEDKKKKKKKEDDDKEIEDKRIEDKKKKKIEDDNNKIIIPQVSETKEIKKIEKVKKVIPKKKIVEQFKYLIPTNKFATQSCKGECMFECKKVIAGIMFFSLKQDDKDNTLICECRKANNDVLQTTFKTGFCFSLTDANCPIAANVNCLGSLPGDKKNLRFDINTGIQSIFKRRRRLRKKFI